MNDYDINDVASIFSDMSVYEAIEVLQRFGVSVYDADGAFRSLYDVIEDIAKLTMRTMGSSSRRLFDAAQCLIDSFNDVQCEMENEALDDFLKEFTLKEVC